MWVRTPLNVSPDRNPTLNKTGAFRWLAGFIERCAAADWTPFANPPGVDRIGVFLRSKDLREPHIDYERQFDDPWRSRANRRPGRPGGADPNSLPIV